MQHPLTAIIVDDETEGIHTLQFMLEEYCPWVNIISTYDSSVTGLKAIKKQHPQLLFLDINMPQINGLELLEILGAEQYSAIFTTAHDQFILQALRLNAIDYLLKPIDENELVNAVKRVQPKQHLHAQQINNVLSLVNHTRIDPQTPIAIKIGNKLRFIPVQEITHCQSDGNFTYIHLMNGKSIYSSSPLIHFEEILPTQYFYRIHREYIVNKLRVLEYNKADGGIVTIARNYQLPVSRGRKEDFLRFLEQLLI